MSVDRVQVEEFRRLVTARFGFRYDADRLELLADALRSRLAASDAPTVIDYLQRLAAAPPHDAEVRALADVLTVAETFFFRNADHFRAFVEEVVPACMRAGAGQRRLRILSAGCASGEEAYTIAMLIRGSLPALSGWDVSIVAIDVNPTVLARAAVGRYSAWSLRATIDEVRARWFREVGRDFVLDPAIRAMVRFEERNLIVEDPAFWQPDAWDVVFCRNVLMYFEPPIMGRIIERIRRSLSPGGFLFLGHAETLRGVSQDFELCHTHDTFYYRGRPGAALEASPPPTGAAVLPAVVDEAPSWIAAIQRASDRIAALDRGRRGRDARRPTLAPSWDLGAALDLLRQERHADALDALHQLPADAQRDPDVLLLRAVLLTNHGRLDDAERVCAELEARGELSAGAHYLTALSREHAGDAARAVEHDRTAIYLDATFSMPRLHLGLLAKRGGDRNGARREFAEAIGLLRREDASRLLLFGGGFSRETLIGLCRAELRVLGADA